MNSISLAILKFETRIAQVEAQSSMPPATRSERGDPAVSTQLQQQVFKLEALFNNYTLKSLTMETKIDKN